MSYILEALKKSDQKRRQGDVPDLQTIHVPLNVETQASRWPYIVIVVLLMGIVFMLGLMKPWQSSIAPSATPVNQASVKRESEQLAPVVVQAETSTTETDTQAVRIEQVETQEPVVEKIIQPSAVIQPVEIDQASIPHLEDLPKLVQKAIPNMSFAGHVYSSNPLQRSVIINGSAMAEGDRIIDGLRIEQITSRGVIFDYQAQLFRIDILQDWSFD